VTEHDSRTIHRDPGGTSHHPAVTLRKDLSRAIRGGHPWLFAEALAVPAGLQVVHDGGADQAASNARTDGAALASGTIVDVVNRGGRFIARGVYDPASPIAVRIWTLDAGEEIDARLIRGRVQAARSLRQGVIDPATTDAYRLLHGEGDRLPGIVCDVYADTAVIQLDTDAVRRFVPPLTKAIRQAVPEIRRVVMRWRIVLRRRAATRRRAPDHGGATAGTMGGVEVLAGPPLDGPILVREHGLRFEVDIARGQKTGFYLDQRKNRRRARELAAGRRVLNLFAYTGGFSVAAAIGGARRVTTVDAAAPAIEAARRNFALNGLEPGAAAFTFVVADAFDYLAACRETFDLVIVDPPSMAPSKAALDRALAAYRRLNALALARVARGGLLFTASCSSHVTEARFEAAVRAAAADAGRTVRVVERAGAGGDHPVLAGFAEGGYLKGLWVEVG